MAATWYPIVDESKCVNCNACADFCTHGVYTKGDSAPKVSSPDACVEFCRGCSKICPTEAISYFGDN